MNASYVLSTCGQPWYREAPLYFHFFFQAEDGIRDLTVTGVQTCALPILDRVHEHCPLLVQAIVQSSVGKEALTRTIVRRLYQQGAVFVHTIYGDPYIQRARIRSEERRVGKEWRRRWAAYQ